ncbi:MAG TPA: hypothetical protein VKE29_06965 [Candidatus Udaeobacter sp.]|nr:hypothetical protein [Candidatus Udaeobacter sp.]
MRAFWDGWLAWSRERGINYFIGRTLAPRLAPLGLTNVSGTAETAVYNGGSLWADYWIDTITELRGDLIKSGKLDEALIDKFLAFCADSQLVDSDDCFHGGSRPCARWLSRSGGCDFASIE